MTIKLLPFDIEFNDWACQIRINLPNVQVPLPPDDVKNWRGWASQLVYSNGLKNVPLPIEIAYPNTEDWRIWASYFIGTIS